MLSSITVASDGDIALTEYDYKIRVAQAANFIEKVEETSHYVTLNTSLSIGEKIQYIDSLAKLKHRLSKDNKDVRNELRERRRERRRNERFDIIVCHILCDQR